jgi:hypothetical protein
MMSGMIWLASSPRNALQALADRRHEVASRVGPLSTATP